MAEVPLEPKANDRKQVVYFLLIVVITFAVYAAAMLLMYWTDSLVFKPFVRELPADAFWVAPPGGAVRTEEEVAARVAFVNDYLDRS